MGLQCGSGRFAMGWAGMSGRRSRGDLGSGAGRQMVPLPQDKGWVTGCHGLCSLPLSSLSVPLCVCVSSEFFTPLFSLSLPLWCPIPPSLCLFALCPQPVPLVSASAFSVLTVCPPCASLPSLSCPCCLLPLCAHSQLGPVSLPLLFALCPLSLYLLSVLPAPPSLHSVVLLWLWWDTPGEDREAPWGTGGADGAAWPCWVSRWVKNSRRNTAGGGEHCQGVMGMLMSFFGSLKGLTDCPSSDGERRARLWGHTDHCTDHSFMGLHYHGITQEFGLEEEET